MKLIFNIGRNCEKNICDCHKYDQSNIEFEEKDDIIVTKHPQIPMHEGCDCLIKIENNTFLQ